MQYNNDGTKLFTVHQQSTVGHTAKIVEWSLSTAYDPMTASTNADFNDTSTYFETGEALVLLVMESLLNLSLLTMMEQNSLVLTILMKLVVLVHKKLRNGI